MESGLNGLKVWVVTNSVVKGQKFIQEPVRVSYMEEIPVLENQRKKSLVF